MIYVGVDVGGMSIKIGLVDSEGKIIISKSFATEQEKGFKSMFARTADKIKELINEADFSLLDLGGIGIGIPGTVDSKKGMIVSAVNIGCKNENLVEEMSQYFNVPIAVGNDANMAALGEQRFGAGKGHENVVMITLGTGIGGGIIIDGKLYEGNGGAGGEVGHQIIEIDGEECNCGRLGCWEKYASATGLINQTKHAMAENANSLMHKIVAEQGEVNGKTAFLAKDAGDEAGAKVVEQYLHYLAEGLLNLGYVLHPEMFIIGGGISHEGENVMLPLQEKLNASLEKSGMMPYIDVVKASLGNSAGIIGAAALVM